MGLLPGNSIQPGDLVAFLRKRGMIEAGDWRAARLGGDGSDRRFYRLSRLDPAASLIAILPAGSADPAAAAKGRAEAAAAHAIGRHLHRAGVPVPAIHGYDPESGLLLCEDLGDTLLHIAVTGPAAAAATGEAIGTVAPLASSADRETLIIARYREAIDILIPMQLRGGRGFDTDWCCDTRHYDRQLMLSRESGYFVQSFCRDYLGLTALPAGLQREFEALADRAAGQPAGYFLHRDFQSRNLMVHQGRLRVIDFQGGRLGPLGYDLASLLIDPYVALPERLRAQLRHYYLEELGRCQAVDVAVFLEGYYCLALQRNLQILGAFAFLSRVRGKTFFRGYIEPAARSLHEHLAKSSGADYPCLRTLTSTCLERLEATATLRQHPIIR